MGGALDSFCGAVQRVNFFGRKVDMQTLATLREYRADSARGHFMFTALKSWKTVFRKMVKDLDAPAYPHLFEIIRGGWTCKPPPWCSAPITRRTTKARLTSRRVSRNTIRRGSDSS